MTPRCPNDCSQKGDCNMTSLKCKCNQGWGGADCAKSVSCPRDTAGNLCSNNGICKKGRCFCAEGFGGLNCGARLCSPPDCNGRGVCEASTGRCKCSMGWSGSACDVLGCGATNCSSHGRCGEDDTCECQMGWGGVDCSKRVKPRDMVCPSMCSGHGICEVPSGQGNYPSGICVCDSLWSGADCATPGCPTAKGGNRLKPVNCSGNGACVSGPSGALKCRCATGFKGKACDIRACVDGCVNGLCLNGTCKCSSGYRGSACNQSIVVIKANKTVVAPAKLCPNNCSGHGTCVNGNCTCQSPYVGAGCRSRPHSLEECSVCVAYQCVQECKSLLISSTSSNENCYSACSSKNTLECMSGTDVEANLRCKANLKLSLANGGASLPVDIQVLAQESLKTIDSESETKTAN